MSVRSDEEQLLERVDLLDPLTRAGLEQVAVREPWITPSAAGIEACAMPVTKVAVTTMVSPAANVVRVMRNPMTYSSPMASPTSCWGHP